MIYLKIFLRQLIILSLLFAAGCVSHDNIVVSESIGQSASESVGEIKKNEETAVVSEPEQNNQEDSALLVEESDSVVIETVVWTAPADDNAPSELLLPVIQIREPPIIAPVISISSKNLQELEMRNIPSSLTDLDQSSRPEVVIETVQERNTLPETSLHKEVVTKEIPSKIIVNESQMSAIIMTEIDITLPGRGWIYLSYEENKGIEYIGRRFINDSTVYTFFPELEELVVLQFQFQDLINSNHTIEKIYLTVLPEKNDIDKDDVSSFVEVQPPEKDNSADLEDSLLNFLANEDSHGVSEIVPALVESNLPSIQKHLPEVAELLFRSSLFVKSAFVLEELIKNKTLNIPIDRFLFLLGKIYEEDSPIRNERTSVGYYKLLLDGYPASIYWEDSQDRYRFLKRRYIDIR